MKNKSIKYNQLKQQLLIFPRYLILLVIGLILTLTNWAYDFLLILTIYPVNFLLNINYHSIVLENIISLQALGMTIQIIPACVAVSAYFLLLILNLTTSMPIKTRVYSILSSFLFLLFVNILRIYVLSLMFLNNSASFEVVHKIFWYLLSTIFVVLIWFLTVYIFKIKKIPVYSDIKSLLLSIK